MRPMTAIQLKSEFTDILQPLGTNAGDFFLAASLYHAHKVSFAAAAELAGLGFEEFHYRLREHFGKGLILDDESVREDIATAQEWADDGR